MDKITLRGIDCETCIGVHGWEQRVARPLVVDLELGADTREAAASDQLRDALDYAAVAQAVTAFVAETRVALLETLAERLARMLFERYPILSARVAIAKPGAVAGVKSVGVEIERRREDYAACGR